MALSQSAPVHSKVWSTCLSQGVGPVHEGRALIWAAPSGSSKTEGARAKPPVQTRRVQSNQMLGEPWQRWSPKVAVLRRLPHFLLFVRSSTACTTALRLSRSTIRERGITKLAGINMPLQMYLAHEIPLLFMEGISTTTEEMQVLHDLCPISRNYNVTFTPLLQKHPLQRRCLLP